jgi:hypothetical protein
VPLMLLDSPYDCLLVCFVVRADFVQSFVDILRVCVERLEAVGLLQSRVVDASPMRNISECNSNTLFEGLFTSKISEVQCLVLSCTL